MDTWHIPDEKNYPLSRNPRNRELSTVGLPAN
jgi:hypothetical protein